jgi:hypothetical protein
VANQAVCGCNKARLLPQTLCLGWGVRIAQAVNTPEMGRARRLIRIQLVVLVDDEDDVIFKNDLPQVVLGYFLNELKYGLQNHSMYNG